MRRMFSEKQIEKLIEEKSPQFHLYLHVISAGNADEIRFLSNSPEKFIVDIEDSYLSLFDNGVISLIFYDDNEGHTYTTQYIEFSGAMLSISFTCDKEAIEGSAEAWENAEDSVSLVF
ncbi:MAG: hypothetical protein J6S85_21815 [Methanobrevibacter sp.]|nr:hypothetical protein [Methanobrevibacter sp.]